MVEISNGNAKREMKSKMNQLFEDQKNDLEAMYLYIIT